MAKKDKNNWGSKKTVKKRTSIGDSKRSRPKNKSANRKKSRGQGSGRK